MLRHMESSTPVICFSNKPIVHIKLSDYLPGLMREMVALTREKNIPWVTFGPRSKKGHPHHPLYLRKDSTPEPFDVENYLNTCFE